MLKIYYWNYLCTLLDYMDNHHIEDLVLEAEIISLRWKIRRASTVSNDLILRVIDVSRNFQMLIGEG